VKHAIDPKVDCVFKALLGAPENSNLLVNFLNAMLGEHLSSPVQSVEILNPYNEREFINDKLNIVDIKALDAEGQLFQVEIQLASYPSLPGRMLYNWADIYSQQLKSGDKYGKLKPCYAIWMLDDNIHHDDDYLHHFQMRDRKGRILSEHCHITVLELKKFHQQTILNNQQRWLQFFNEAESLDEAKLPDWMQTQEMQQAMSTLRRFSEKDRAYFEYKARQDYISEQKTIQYEREQEILAKKEEIGVLAEEKQQIKQEKEQIEQEIIQIEQEKEQIEQEKQVALAEIIELKALLAQQNKER
jgi:predicted transposase/invertase (TIGR01784 family)